MKNLKKFLALTLALCMLFCFAGCKNEGDSNANSDSTSKTSSTPATSGSDTETDSPADYDFTTVTEGKLTMATNAYFEPYEYYDGDNIVGIDAEIAAAIAEKLGLELEIEDMAFDSIITAVKGGDADLGLAGMTITDERLESVNFSISYAKGVQVIIVKEGSTITSVDDLYADGAAYKVGTQLGTTGYIYATDDFGEELVTPYTTGNEAVSALLGGDVDCVIIDNEPAKSFVANNTGLKILETTYADEDYAACISKDNQELLDAINSAIMELTADGTIQNIVNKYIK